MDKNVKKQTKNKIKSRKEKKGENETVDESATGEESLSDLGSTDSRSSRPGPKSSKTGGTRGESEHGEDDVRPQGAKRKEVSPLTKDSGNMTSEKRRKCKPWRRLVDSDRDSGSEEEVEVLDEQPSKFTLNLREGRTTRAARREKVVAEVSPLTKGARRAGKSACFPHVR